MYILGISAFYHDSAIAIIKDGEILFAAQEERYTRVKHDRSFPFCALKNGLRFLNIDINEIDEIVFYEKPLLKLERILESFFAVAPKGFELFSHASIEWMGQKLFQENLILENLALAGRTKSTDIKYSLHHLSHAASAYYPSGFESACILTVDGVGEWTTLAGWHGQGNELKLLFEQKYPHSLGLLYSAITYFLGFEVNDGEYKVMGLAPYGEGKYIDTIKTHLININLDGSFTLNVDNFSFLTDLKMTGVEFEKIFNIKRRGKDDEIKQIHKDIARSIQEVLEEVMLLLTKTIKDKTKENNLCLAGGVALNCVANEKIIKNNDFKNVWVQPASADSGGALGAALAYNFLTESPEKTSKSLSMTSAQLGESYREEEIESILKSNNIKYQKLEDPILIERIVSLLAENKIGGWFKGRSEYGPRALGGRSIIGNAFDPEIQKTLNLKIKKRESFRPFAPAVLENCAHELFDLGRKSEFMLFTSKLKAGSFKSKFPGVIHVDNSARLQTVGYDHVFSDLLNEVKKIMGHGIVVNTSFNVKDEPIVNDPLDALISFYKADLDFLVIENFLIFKNENVNQENIVRNKKETQKNDLLELSVSHKLLVALIFYCFVIPVGIIFKILGKDPLQRKIFGKTNLVFLDRQFKDDFFSRPY